MVGMGRIGQAIAVKLDVFKCEVAYHARNRRNDLGYRYFPDLAEMAEQSEILIAITPGGPQTCGLIDAEVIEALGPHGTLVNVARRSVVDEKALVDALRNGKLGAAGLDVFADEHRVPDALLDMDNVVLLPHVGSATVETRKAMGDLAVENLVSWFTRGEAVTPVPECS